MGNVTAEVNPRDVWIVLPHDPPGYLIIVIRA